MSCNETGWVALAGRWMTAGDDIVTIYNWDETYWNTKEAAISAGFPLAGGTDDFNLAHVENGNVTWWGWMDEQHPIEDAAEAAMQHGWSVFVQKPEVQS